MSEKVTIEIELEEELYQQIMAVCEQDNITLDEFIERAIKWYFEKEEKNGESKDEGKTD